MNLKFTLAEMFFGLAIAAVALGALVNGTVLWGQVIFLLATFLLLMSIVGAIMTRRGFYIGFSIFAGIHGLLVIPPAWGHEFATRFPTWSATQSIHELIRSEEGELVGSRWQVTYHPNLSQYRKVVQPLWVIGMGFLGGVVGSRFQDPRRRGARAPT